jgi:hypothetical protein
MEANRLDVVLGEHAVVVVVVVGQSSPDSRTERPANQPVTVGILPGFVSQKMELFYPRVVVASFQEKHS